MQVSSKEKFWLTAPITFFLLVMLGFPLLLDLIYSVSEVTFENLLSPRLQGFENYFEINCAKSILVRLRYLVTKPQPTHLT